MPRARALALAVRWPSLAVLAEALLRAAADGSDDATRLAGELAAEALARPRNSPRLHGASWWRLRRCGCVLPSSSDLLLGPHRIGTDLAEAELEAGRRRAPAARRAQ